MSRSEILVEVFDPTLSKILIFSIPGILSAGTLTGGYKLMSLLYFIINF